MQVLMGGNVELAQGFLAYAQQQKVDLTRASPCSFRRCHRRHVLVDSIAGKNRLAVCPARLGGKRPRSPTPYVSHSP